MSSEEQEHFRLLDKNPDEYLESLTQLEKDLKENVCIPGKTLQQTDKFIKWTKMFIRINFHLNTGHKLKLEWVYEVIREAEFLQMPCHHPGYSSLLEHVHLYENWVHRYMKYLQNTTEFMHGYLSSLVNEAELLRIDTDDILNSLRTNVTKYEVWKRDSESLIAEFKTTAKGSDIPSLEKTEEKVQSLIDEIVSAEYSDIIKQLHQVKWMIKVYKLLTAFEKSSF